MKCPIIVASALVLAAVGVVFHFSDDGSEPPEPATPTKRTGSREVTSVGHPPQVPEPFTAVTLLAPEVIDADHQPKVTFIRPEDLGVRSPRGNVDHPARIRELIAAGDLATLQSATLSWFEHEPAAASDWLAAQPDLEELQPAISLIAHRVSEGGKVQSALEWAALLTDGTLYENTVFDIHALALRNGQLSPADIPAGLIADSRMEELLNGAPGD